MIDAAHSRCGAGLQSPIDRLLQWLRPLLPVILALGFLHILAHGHLLFTTVLTNHSFPNLWHWDFPSYRTVLEGRWGADLMYALQGGRGIPLLLMALAIPLQILNGLLFARLLEVESRRLVFLLAALVSLHPFFSDYYGFGGDHLALVLGDTLILLGFLLAVQGARAWLGRVSMAAWPWGAGPQPLAPSGRAPGRGQLVLVVVLAGSLIQFGISMYQPKIGFVATLGLLLALHQIARWPGSLQELRGRAMVVLVAALSVIFAVASYAGLFRWMQAVYRRHEAWGPALDSEHAMVRTGLLEWSALPERLAALPPLLRELTGTITDASAVLPPLPLLFATMFLVLLSWRVLQVARPLSAVLVLIGAGAASLLVPVAILITHLVSASAYPAWRFWSALPYAFGFLVVSTLWLGGALQRSADPENGTTAAAPRYANGLPRRSFATVGLAVAGTLVWLLASFAIYRFVLINAEIGQAAQMRTQYETALVAGIATRIDQRLRSDAEPADGSALPVVVVGERPAPQTRFLRVTGVRSNLTVPAFIHYRQVEYLNFYLGRDALRSATADEEAMAREAAAGLPAWPAQNSVTVLESGVVLVILETQ